ncbi:MAG: hypothetical protein HYY18_01375 [Planctomycetes bacterium]|nr:hypothetical protein [Planctomycetota bacterium]
MVHAGVGNASPFGRSDSPDGVPRDSAKCNFAHRLFKAAIALVALAISCFLVPPVRYQLIMGRAHARMERADMGYTVDVEDWLALLDTLTIDKVWLANRLLAESDGSLACEGMILAYRVRHSDLRRILEDHLTDERWNWSMTLNSRVARNLLDLLDGRDERVEKYVEDWVSNWPHQDCSS